MLKKRKRASQFTQTDRYVFGALRKIWGWTPAKRQALLRASIGLNVYKCEQPQCLRKPLLRGDVHVDHVMPVVPTTGWVDWNTHFANLFCPAEGLMVLCKTCHLIKTSAEAALRTEARRAKKKTT